MSTSELHQQAADPSTDLAELATLAHAHVELRPVVALNPSAYDGLLDWLGQLGDPAVNAALAQRRGEPAAAPSPWTWHEPNRHVALRWGTYPLRYGLSLGLVLTAMLFPFYLFTSGGYFGLATIVLLTIAAAALAPSPVVRRIVASALALVFVLAVVLANLGYEGIIPDVFVGI